MVKVTPVGIRQTSRHQVVYKVGHPLPGKRETGWKRGGEQVSVGREAWENKRLGVGRRVNAAKDLSVTPPRAGWRLTSLQSHYADPAAECRYVTLKWRH